MQRKKSRKELLYTPYLNIAQIKELLDVSKAVAKKIYIKSQQIDKEQLGDYLSYENKVRIGSVTKVSGISLQTLERQIKNADALAQQSAER